MNTINCSAFEKTSLVEDGLTVSNKTLLERQ